MIKILFICHGNICRSPMAEFVMKDMVRRQGLEADFEIASAATSREEIGNPVYPPARRKLAEHGIGCAGHHARQITKYDYGYYNQIICMDHANIRSALRICGGDPERKIRLLLDFTNRPGEEVADPWYTGDFDATWRDVTEGCAGLIEQLKPRDYRRLTRFLPVLETDETLYDEENGYSDVIFRLMEALELACENEPENEGLQKMKQIFDREESSPGYIFQHLQELIRRLKALEAKQS